MKIALCLGWGDSAYTLNRAYVKYVVDAGFTPVLLCPDSDIKEAAATSDGLLLPGGIDLDPTFYGEENYCSYKCNPERDNFERRVYHTFIEAGKKIFGICRGFQLIVNEFMRDNNTKELTFQQHIDDHALLEERSVARNVRTHSVMANVQKMYGSEDIKTSRIFVNSIHHQVVLANKKVDVIVGKNPDTRFEVIASTDFALDVGTKLKIVEGVDLHIGDSHIMAVQWHPEELRDVELLSRFFGGAVQELEAKIDGHTVESESTAEKK